MITKQLEAALTLGPLTQLLRLRDVLAITDLEKTQVYRLMAIGKFPKTAQDRTPNTPVDSRIGPGLDKKQSRGELHQHGNICNVRAANPNATTTRRPGNHKPGEIPCVPANGSWEVPKNRAG